MFVNVLFPAITLIVLSLSVGLIHFISSSMLIGKGKEWGDNVPLEPYEKSPVWLRLQKNNLQNLFEYPVIFYFLVAVSYSQGISSDLLIYSAWLYVLFRLLHSVFHIFMRNGLLRSTPWIFSQVALLIMLIGFCIEMI